MKNIEQKINDLLVAGQGVLVRRDHRAIGAQLDYALRRGLLRSTLPGVYTAAPPSLEAHIRAAALFRPRLNFRESRDQLPEDRPESGEA